MEHSISHSETLLAPNSTLPIPLPFAAHLITKRNVNLRENVDGETRNVFRDCNFIAALWHKLGRLICTRREQPNVTRLMNSLYLGGLGSIEWHFAHNRRCLDYSPFLSVLEGPLINDRRENLKTQCAVHGENFAGARFLIYLDDAPNQDFRANVNYLFSDTFYYIGHLDALLGLNLELTPISASARDHPG